MFITASRSPNPLLHQSRAGTDAERSWATMREANRAKMQRSNTWPTAVILASLRLRLMADPSGVRGAYGVRITYSKAECQALLTF